MTTEVVTQRCVPGKTKQGVKWASKIVAYYKKAGSAKILVLQPTTGQVISEFVLIAHWPSLADLEKEFKRRATDPGWIAIMNEMLESDWHLSATRNLYEIADSTH